MIRINLQFFGGRGASSSSKGGDTLGIGRRGMPKSEDYAMNNANPNFFNSNAEAEGWEHNCQSCVLTFEAMMRGYDTEALPHKKGDPYFVGNGVEHQWYDCFEGQKTIKRVGYDEYKNALKSGDIDKALKLSKKVGAIWSIEGQTVAVNTKTAIDRQMKAWGDGARATLSVAWKKGYGGGGHIINVINKGGKTIAIDAQSHRIQDLDKMLMKTKTNYTALTRVDNLKFTSDIQYLTKGK